MDPNEALRIIRATAEAMESPDCHAEQRAILAGDLIEHFHALDEWLQRGGFLPEAWQYTDRGPRSSTTFRFGKPVPAFPREARDYGPEPLGGPIPGVNGSHLPDTLTGLSREIDALPPDKPGRFADVLHLAGRVGEFAQEHPDLDPETHMRLMVKLARHINPECPADLDRAREVIRHLAEYVVRRADG